ncbi:porin family protein [Porphyrobacter sp. YT40]|uniref:outer membrane beta-barrel protein n=1 Tax=Porphyrobacter sp. YT40 TaxID=2547601 RepID=UPI0011431D2D|nr:porin family protein [Porphyrobacter sp. YT40]QDH35298.1 porin family protein [Porphyrobacter sp. YT40]
MRLVTFAAAASLAAIATSAQADETRVEVRTGIVWCCGVSDETIGLAVGHDFDLGGDLFAGVEAVADTNFDFVDPTIGVNARLGTKLGEQTKVFGLVGYAYETDFDIDDAVVGAGVQHNVGEKALLSLQYQRYLDLDINRVAVGVGLRF